jgi:FAD-dependent urate hydroxylase
MTRANAVKSAAIIGGGIAGAAAALALDKAGVTPVVYEAYPGTAEGVGAFLTVATNGIDALRVLDAAGPVLDLGFPTPAITLRSGTGKRLGDTPTGYPLPDGTVSHTITRADLYTGMQRLVRDRGIRVEHGKRLVDATDTGHGVRADFADGTTASADILVGCDGVHSTVRGLIDSHAPAPRYEGLVTTGGYAAGVAAGIPGDGYEMIFGKRAFFGYAAASDGRVWWFANLPWQPEPPHSELRALTQDERRRLLADAFADDAGPGCALIDASPEIAPFSAIHTLARLRSWHRGRMVVIGDAAHAPSPTSGQGASLSAEDAVLLALCLRDAPEPATAFSRFEALRRKRVEPIVRWAARFNRSKAAGPVGRVIRDAMLPAGLRMAAGSKAQRQIFDYHLDWQAGISPTPAAPLAH